MSIGGEDGATGAEFVDANIVVRYYVQDQPDVLDIVRRIIDEHPHLMLTEGTITEVGYVLTRRYGIARAVIVDALISLLQRQNVSVYQLDTDIVIQALMLCRPSGRVSFADAMLWASARQRGTGSVVYSLGRRFPSFGITLRSKAPNQQPG